MSKAPVRSDFCFVHAADLHLGGRRWLRSEPADRGFSERVRLADRLALRALVDLCLEERAAILLLAGDIIDGWCRDHRVALELVHQLFRLRDAECDVALVLGNHDVRTRLMKPMLLPGWARVLGVGAPETQVLERLGVALHGWSFPEAEALTDIATLYPAPIPGLVNVGLLHTSADGRRGHAAYAPCSRRTLRAHGYDYWALGHVHAREVISTCPWIIFPGNLQGRGPQELGPKGATLAKVRDGRVVSAEHRALDALRFETIIANTEDTERFDDLLAVAHAALARATEGAGGRPVVARLVLSGIAGAAAALSVPQRERSAALRAAGRELCGASMWLDEVWVDGGPVAGAWRVELAT
jgi:DNA repair exonuclease SbcCD nuclease subunit